MSRGNENRSDCGVATLTETTTWRILILYKLLLVKRCSKLNKRYMSFLATSHI